MSGFQPQRFGKYVLLRRIAVGGMAEIFRAKVGGFAGFEKDVVIKRILPHYGEDEAFTRMFIDEARLTAKLQHQNIVQIFDFDVIDNRYFIAMEYIEGKDLKDVVERAEEMGERLTVAQAVFIAMEVAKGLHYAHTREDGGKLLGIVHRDVTPSNVMIAYRGDIKLMDFGIATAAQRTTKTQAGAVKGKVAYMSPEQAHGRPVDARTDVFALGVVLWELLTGRRLFLAESDFETLTNIVRMPAQPPSAVDPRVPADLDALVLKCLERDVEKRWANMDLLARELTRWYYAHVPDVEREKLRPMMLRLFKPEIDALEQEAEKERVDFLGLAPTSGSSVESTRHDRQAVSSLLVDPAVTRTTTTPLAAEATRFDPGPVKSPDVVLARRADEAPPRPPRRTRWGLVALGGLLLGGVGVAIPFLFMPPAPPAPSPPVEAAVSSSSAPAPVVEGASLLVVVDPPTARVRVDGELVDGLKKGLAVGAVARVVVEAPGYARHEALVTVDQKATRVEVALVREKLARRVAIRPSEEHDEVWVDGVRLGLGARVHEGVDGQTIRVRVVPASGAPAIERDVVLGPDTAIVAVRTPGKVVVSVEPPDARVTADPGALEPVGPGLVAITGVPIGDRTTLRVEAPGHTPVTKQIDVASANDTLRIALSREAQPDPRPATPRPSATPSPNRPPASTPPASTPPASTPPATPPVAGDKGRLVVTATPSAAVTVGGLPRGSTPVTLQLPPGKHTVVLSKGARVETRHVNLQPGEETTVFVDFSR